MARKGEPCVTLTMGKLAVEQVGRAMNKFRQRLEAGGTHVALTVGKLEQVGQGCQDGAPPWGGRGEKQRCRGCPRHFTVDVPRTGQ